MEDQQAPHPAEQVIEFSRIRPQIDRFLVDAGRVVNLYGDIQYSVNGEAVDEVTYNLAKVAAVDAQPARCRSCHAPIFWRKLHTNPNGPANPINPIPDPAGNVVLVDMETYRVIPPFDLKNPRPPGQLRYTSHFQTCPQRAEWRRKNAS